jgi:hypothetical protein
VTADPPQFRRLVREAVDRPLREVGFERSGRRNLWLREASGLAQGIGFYGTRVGGDRRFEWGVWIPGVEQLVANHPKPGPTSIADCHLRGELGTLLERADFREVMVALGGGYAPMVGTDEQQVVAAIDRVRKTTALFLAGLERFQQPRQVLQFLLETPDDENRRMWPRGTLTMVYAAALAVATNDSRRTQLADAALDAVKGNTLWTPIAERVAAAAQHAD